MGAFLAMVGKDLILLSRDRTGLFFTLAFPLLMAVFFGSVFSSGGGSQSISVVVVDEDDTVESRAFIELIAANDQLDVERADKAGAVAMVQRGDQVAYLLVPAGFGNARQRLFWGAPPTVELGVDPSRRAEAAMLEGMITQQLVGGFQALFGDREASRRVVAQAIKGLELAGDGAQPAQLRRFLGELDRFLDAVPAPSVNQPSWSPASVRMQAVMRDGRRPPSGFAISFPQGIVWGLMMCAMTFAMGLVTERTEGTLMRLRIAPVSRGQILAGKAGACFALVLAVQASLLVIGALLFGIEVASVPAATLACLCVAVCFVGIMMLLSVLGKTEKAASGYATAMMLVMMMIGGGMIPLFAMPAWMQSISHVSPVKWAVLALEGSTWRAFELGEMVLPCAVLVGVGLACFAIGTRLFRDA